MDEVRPPWDAFGQGGEFLTWEARKDPGGPYAGPGWPGDLRRPAAAGGYTR